jgi:hypothetical protein
MKAETGIMTGPEISGIRIITGINLPISSKTGVNMQTGVRISGIATAAETTALSRTIMEETGMEITETNA